MTFPVDILTRCWLLAGPTAVGKSATSLALARKLNAEIVSMDSMAVYRGMDIGTAKPSPEEQAQVPHHLIDVADPSENFSVADYLSLAQRAARDIVDRKRVPLFVGGTGLYLRSILRGVFDGPAADWEFRKRLERIADEEGVHALHEHLKHLDPLTACRLHPSDTRRVIRAIEVCELTGQPLSQQQHNKPLAPEHRPAAVLWIEPPRDWLHDRINRRVEQMMEAGLLAETRHLLQRQPPPGRTALQALGYRELIRHLSGESSLEEAVGQIKTATRQFSKRQHTWFRNLEECRRVEVTGAESAEELADQLLA